ncbi:hypothetical protein LUZ60_017463 [Juncus effusus]|nr:hypothetical protein LUZ60_017463 [Juncus effusus]
MIGHWGTRENTFHEMTSASVRLTSIVICSGDVIDSIKFSYEEKDTGNTVTLGPWGGSGGDSTEITFDEDDYLDKITGTYGDYNGKTVIHTLTFFAKGGTQYGPYGNKKGDSSFSVPVKNKQIVGFFAYAGTYINGIGVYANA